VVLHRYVGVVMGLLMLLWFASGIVMLFVHWPEVTAQERAAGLAPLAWGQCCNFSDINDQQPMTGDVVEGLAGRPVLRFDGYVVDLTTGLDVHQVSSDDAARIAGAYAANHGITGRHETMPR
jgi:hypothetical protein